MKHLSKSISALSIAFTLIASKSFAIEFHTLSPSEIEVKTSTIMVKGVAYKPLDIADAMNLQNIDQFNTSDIAALQDEMKEDCQELKRMLKELPDRKEIIFAKDAFSYSSGYEQKPEAGDFDLINFVQSLNLADSNDAGDFSIKISTLLHPNYSETLYLISEDMYRSIVSQLIRTQTLSPTKPTQSTRSLPGNLSLKLFWMQNPGVRDWALGVGKFTEGDKTAEEAYARQFYKWNLDASWSPRDLPSSFSLDLFWKQNPGVRDWALGVSKFTEGDKTAEEAYARQFYKWNLNAKWS
jgi:hypothetical protein